VHRLEFSGLFRWRGATLALAAHSATAVGQAAALSSINGWRESRRHEPQGKAVHAIAKPGRPWSIVEQVAEMSAAPRAQHLGSLHHQAAVAALHHRAPQNLPEARPTGSAVELGRRAEQRKRAAGADEGAAAMLFEQRARERPFGAGLSAAGIAL